MSITNLNNHAILQVSGKDAQQFLQGQLTCDVKKIDETTSTLGAHCNPKGQVLSFFRLFYRDEDYYLLMPSNIIEQALRALKKYALFSKVTLTILQINCYGVLVPKEKITLPKMDNEIVNTDTITSIRVPGKTPRYYMIDFAETLNINSATPEHWHQLDLEAGIPRLYPHTIGEFLPHYLNLPALGAVSFKKGCYTGQEIIARMQHRGKLKQHMVPRYLHTTDIIAPGTKCLTKDNKNMGQIIDSVIMQAEQLCLILLNDNFIDTDTAYIGEKNITMTTT